MAKKQQTTPTEGQREGKTEKYETTGEQKHAKLTGEVNVGKVERVLSAVGGAALVAYGISRKDKAGAALAAAGGVTALRGATGHCYGYGAMGINRAVEEHSPAAVIKHNEGIRVEETVTINKPAAELYRYWRNFENLPRFMNNLESVSIMSETMSHWVAKAPADTTVEWDAQIINEEQDKLVAWKSIEGSQIPNSGSVRFTPAPGNRGTEVRVNLEYNPPAGKLGAFVAKLFGEEPAQQINGDLRRFKNIMEAGEVPTTAGQPVGEKGKS